MPRIPAQARGFAAALSLAVALATSGCTIAGDHHVADGTKIGRSYRSIAGSVHVGRDASIDGAKTIAGNIEVENGATTRTLRTVAGDIRIGRDAKIAGHITTIAGNIHIAPGARISGKVSTIAGNIELNGCRIDGPVHLTKGALHTRDAVAISGGIVLKRDRSFGDDDETPVIDIGPGADVASIEIKPKTEVELRISRQARVGQITGATATYYE